MSLLLLSTSSTASSSLSTNCKIPLQKAPPHYVGKQVSRVSCEQKQSGSDASSHAIDRRNVLLGLGGLYGATTTVGNQAKVAIGAPVQPPDLGTCQKACDDALKEWVDCCPPYTSANIIDFVPPTGEPLRRRKPAHKLTPAELDTFKRAIAKMKELDKNDPWNYMQQATIHCTFCNGAFEQVGYPETLLQVHGGWLFLPWHRFYIYFWERILGKLVGDSTFAIPYWNWDNSDGMRMPPIYLDKPSPLYDDLRNHEHYSGLMDYKYSYGDPLPTQDEEKDVIRSNHKFLYNMYTDGVGKPNLFMGGPVRAGEVAPKDFAGSLENLHNIPHMWVGPEASPNHNMGNFATAARDTMFFGHHANVDRLWSGYRVLRGGKLEFNDNDWLDASFIFYDENKQVVRVKVRDCLETENLGYTYQPEKSEWKDSRRAYKQYLIAKKKLAKDVVSLSPVSEFGPQPRPLEKPIRAVVQRPKTSRSKIEKEDELEVLVIDDIDIEHGRHVRFDVYIAKPIDETLIGPDYGEIAGSFIRIPHSHGKKKVTGKKSKLELGITNLLDDIEAESSGSLVVTLVPRTGKVTVGGLHIQLDEADL